MNDLPVCRTCAVQQPPGPPPDVCPICADDRQYVPATGQAWTTLAELRAEGHRGETEPLEPGITAIEIRPPVGIGQRALHVRTDAGTLLWDCTGYLDDDLVAAVAGLGGVDHIAVSHPHFYGVMVEWAHAFGATVWIPEADRSWVQRPDPALRWWSDEIVPLPGVRVIQCGGHFDGSAVAHVAAADGAGVLLVGDTATIPPDRRTFSFMRSYPNWLPLPPATVRRIVDRCTRYPFARAYGAWTHRAITVDAEATLRRSAERFITWAAGEPPP